MRDITIVVSLAAGLLIAATDPTSAFRDQDSPVSALRTETEAARAQNQANARLSAERSTVLQEQRMQGELQIQQRAQQADAERLRIDQEARERERQRDEDLERARRSPPGK